MQIGIELPEDIAEGLQAEWKDLPRHALEAIALEGYRSGALTESQVRRVLGFETRLEVNSFLREHGIYYNYTPTEIDQEIRTNERLLERTGKARSR
jgi:DNA-binding transcriptional ArsR family regulator